MDDFDRLLRESLDSADAPEEIVHAVRPWTQAVSYLMTGLILTTIHLNFLYLQYLPPTIGYSCVILGLRSLRQENRAFRISWLLSLWTALWWGVNLILTATPISLPATAATVIGIGTELALLLTIRAGFRAVFAKAGLTPDADPLKWAAIWMLAAIVLAFSPLSGSWLAAIPMLGCYILILRALSRLGSMLDEAGYAITPAPVHLSGEVLGWLYTGVLFVLVIGISLFVNHISIDAAPAAPVPEQTGIRTQLEELGFPAELLSELPEESIAPLADAIRVDVKEETLMFDPVEKERTAEDGSTEVYDSPGKNNLRSTMVFIELPQSVLYVVNFFSYDRAPFWQAALSIPSDGRSFTDNELLGGALRYEKGGITYEAPIPRLQSSTATARSWFSGEYTYQVISGAWSYPIGAKNARGYVLYRTQNLEYEEYGGNFLTGTLTNYARTVFPIQLPYTPLEEKLASGQMTFSNNRVQHYTNFYSHLIAAEDPDFDE